jgi:hypothetical protein
MAGKRNHLRTQIQSVFGSNGFDPNKPIPRRAENGVSECSAVLYASTVDPIKSHAADSKDSGWDAISRLSKRGNARGTLRTGAYGDNGKGNVRLVNQRMSESANLKSQMEQHNCRITPNRSGQPNGTRQGEEPESERIQARGLKNLLGNPRRIKLWVTL